MQNISNFIFLHIRRIFEINFVKKIDFDFEAFFP